MEMHAPEHCSTAGYEAAGPKSRGKLFADLLHKQPLPMVQRHTKLFLINPLSDPLWLGSSRGTAKTMLTLKQIIALFCPKRVLY